MTAMRGWKTKEAVRTTGPSEVPLIMLFHFFPVHFRWNSAFVFFSCFPSWCLIWVRGWVCSTFHDVDQRAHIAFLDDAAVFSILHRVHAVHDLLDLGQLQVLHEVIVQNGLLDQILGPAGQDERKWAFLSFNALNALDKMQDRPGFP